MGFTRVSNYEGVYSTATRTSGTLTAQFGSETTNGVWSSGAGNTGTNNSAGSMLIIVSGAWNNVNAPPSLSIADSNLNSYGLIQSTTLNVSSSSQSRCSIWFAKSVAGGSNTVTLTASNGTGGSGTLDLDLAIIEYLTTGAGQTADQMADATSQSASSIESGEITPANASNNLIFSYLYDQTAKRTLSVANYGSTIGTWSSVYINTMNSDGESLGVADQVDVSTGLYGADWSWTGGSDNIHAGIVSFYLSSSVTTGLSQAIFIN